jgi:hypothetical protein
MANTVNVYAAPFARPDITSVVAVELNRTGVRAVWPTHGVTTYAVTGDGMVDGAFQDTVA